MTTTELRKKDFEIVVAPGTDGKASGRLYVDDGESIEQHAVTDIAFTYSHNELSAKGSFAYKTGVNVGKLSFLGVQKAVKKVVVDGKTVAAANVKWDQTTKALSVAVSIPLTKGFTVELV